MSDFCKLFATATFGQIVVMRQNDSEGDPAVYFYAKPAGLDVSHVALSFADSDQGYEQADAAFAHVDEAIAMEAVSALFKHFGGVAQ